MATDNNNKVLNVPNLRFPEFCGEWGKDSLMNIASIFKGSGISKEQLSDSGLPCILYGELYTKYKSEVITDIYSKTDIETKGLVSSKANDVIIPCSGEAAIEIATARCVPMSNILLGGDLNIIRLNGHDGRFFAYQLNGKRKIDIAKVAQGVSVVHLYGEHLKKINVAYPSFAEQNKIAQLLSLIDKRIVSQNKIIEKLESLIKGLCQKLTQQGDSNTTLNECLECYSSTLQENSVFHAGDFPVYGATGVCGYTDSPEANGDSILIIKDGASVGVTYYASGKYSAIGTLNRLVAKNGYSLTYLYYCLKVFNFAQYRTGLAIPHIYFRDYGKAHIWCPPIEEQNQIANALEKVEQKIVTEKSLLEQLYSQKRFLLQTMFI
ncbi:MAG: restriction endonuclease subunit S [Bacteroidales bacterium]|nr:restriction endonuclease subunit S [Bacteroidales bacterium]